MTYTIAVLAGGKSSRFGSNKLLFKIGSRTMLEWVLYAALDSQANEIILSVKSQQFNAPDEFKGKLKVIYDELEEYSPLVGMLSAARAASNSGIVVISADSPFVTSNFFNLLNAYLEKIDVDGVIPIWNNGKIEAIHAAYKTVPVLAACESLINSGNYDVKALPSVLKKVYFLPSSDLGKRDRLSLTDFDNPAEILDYARLN
ncbi:MAG: molybdenum cofactor guanylyltransferase [Nitrososphaerota archaeon]|jgi:molybdopterin-guanine dinucleotide biosynthesis protein A|nr:molybdenum cofactor guanylyltransferase [Nitrososphaerota archaeon]MDG6930871.1 molybdenum cofactor guanylyltransferase [Nitrososphaerota archaeon]MDG6932472.1 molybdenum cofactor guanylyltransferase [Nitrososphaerota archaeon]MDG6936082.1 molybdenum cofactor guanylyltransferase [Nitrososphaerota archaeon]MDG6943726.1 molybdenum cofactor guanylyltransferase [Nitrososphaerota archaeon]